MIGRVVGELEKHAPFTAFGAFTGIVIMVAIVFGDFLPKVATFSESIFYVLHPLHVVLSAIATTALYMKYRKGSIWMAILIGYTGSIFIATLSDSIIPYVGELLLELPNSGAHIGFIEEWWIVNPAALLGIIIGYLKQNSEFPHTGHVLISTWASLFHVIMALGESVSLFQTAVIFLFLFLAVWVPCCTSDIVYPVLFVKKRDDV